MGLRTFTLATLIGIVPGTFIYAYLGRELGAITSLSDLLSMDVLAAFTLLGLVALLPVAHRRWKSARSGPAVLVTVTALGLTAAGGTDPGTALAANAGYEAFVATYDGLLSDYDRPARKNPIAYAGVNYASLRKDPRHAEAMSYMRASNPSEASIDRRFQFASGTPSVDNDRPTWVECRLSASYTA